MSVPITFKFDATEVRRGVEESIRMLTGSTEGVDDVMRDVSRKIEGVMDSVGRDVEKDLKKLISVPVIRLRGKEVRSKPGEPPRKDTGQLYNSVRYVVYRAGRDVTNVVVTTETSYDIYVNATRPYQKIIESKWRGIVDQRIQFTELSV